MPQANKAMDGDTVRSWRRFIREVPIAEHVQDYAVRLVLASHPNSAHAPEAARKFVRYGSSPRGAQTLILGGKVKALLNERFNVSFQDIEEVVLPALRHRLILNFEAQAEGVQADDVIRQIVEHVPHESTSEAA
jgi:MoxR-like ATPase